MRAPQTPILGLWHSTLRCWAAPLEHRSTRGLQNPDVSGTTNCCREFRSQGSGFRVRTSGTISQNHTLWESGRQEGGNKGFSAPTRSMDAHLQPKSVRNLHLTLRDRRAPCASAPPLGSGMDSPPPNGSCLGKTERGGAGVVAARVVGEGIVFYSGTGLQSSSTCPGRRLGRALSPQSQGMP